MPYSVSPRRKLRMVGLKPSWNFRTLIPTRLAARKCPSSCTKISTPSTNAKDRSVVKPGTSDLQFYPAGDLQRIVPRPFVDGAHFCQRLHLERKMSVHRAFDDLCNIGKREAPLEKPRDRDLVRGIQHHRQTGRAGEGAKREPQQRQHL